MICLRKSERTALCQPDFKDTKFYSLSGLVKPNFSIVLFNMVINYIWVNEARNTGGWSMQMHNTYTHFHFVFISIFRNQCFLFSFGLALQF